MIKKFVKILELLGDRLEVCVSVFAIRVKNSVDPDQMASSGSTVFSKRKNPNSA